MVHIFIFRFKDKYMNQAVSYFPTPQGAVSSALKGLTSGFGMVPGVTPSALPPNSAIHFNNLD